MNGITEISFVAALAFTGLLCGASLDQSIKQLPARQTIGVKMFSAYAKAADLKNGVPWYAVLGISSALFTIVCAILTLIHYPRQPYALSLSLAGVSAVCHTICTMLAAPTYHQQKAITDERQLRRLFDRFERIQTVRSLFILANFLCLVGALVLLIP
jgi:L-asparagine transporter-like permease